MKKSFLKVAVSGALAISSLFVTVAPVFAQNNSPLPLEEVNQKFIDVVDADYGFQLAQKLTEFKTNQDLGFRTAGSEAEHQAGDFLFSEMEAIGLNNVSKEEFNLDSWTFEKAEMTFQDTSGNDHKALLSTYQVNFDTAGPQEFEVVYLNKGTAEDYTDVDVKGKLVLIDIDQREEWWINYPAYEAYLHEAAAVIAVQMASFGEISPDALNSNDLVGPANTPAFSMSQTDANLLKDSLKENDNSLMVQFDAKSTVVEEAGTAYNITGQILGKDPDSYIVMSAHYDAYFDGFQDNSTAVGMMMGIAKALVDSGYQPEKTIVFLATAAEEWGATNTRYDWSIGAYTHLFKLHPEWQEQAVLNINFEMPGIESFTTHYMKSVRELETYLNDFVASIPVIEGAYPEGMAVTSPTGTWADDFSFSIAGIPSVRNSFDDAEFGLTTYHSQFDDINTHNQAAYLHNHILYGLLAIHYDRTAVMPLDFTTTMSAFEESLNTEIMTDAGVESEALSEKIAAVNESAAAVNERISEVNITYLDALNGGDSETASNLYTDSLELNAQLKTAFRFVQDELTRLTWEDDNTFGHVIVTDNLTNLYAAVEALENGEATLALDEYLWAVDNNWYAYFFSKENFDYFNDYVLEQTDERLFWGAGRIVGHVDLFDVITSLSDKLEDKNTDYMAEITALNDAIASQEALLANIIDQETMALEQLAKLLQ